MKQLLTILILSIAITAKAQQTDTIPAFKKTPYIPEFSILQTDSTWFGKTDLPKHKPVAIIYFSPDCGHCQLTAQEFVTKMDELKDVTLVWVSKYSPAEIKKFAAEYKLDRFENVRLGKDTKYFLPVFYDIRFTPFIAVYDNKGKLLQTYPEGTDPDTLATLIHAKS